MVPHQLDGGRRAPLRPSAQTHREPLATFVFRLNNIESLITAYAAEAAYEITNVIKQHLAHLADGHGRAICLAEGVAALSLWDLTLLGDGPISVACERFLEDFISTFTMDPIPVLGGPVHAILSGTYTLAAEDDAPRTVTQMAESLLDEANALPIKRSQGWAVNYRDDMRLAATLLSDLAADKIQYAWQPIRRGESQCGALYYECLLRVGASDALVSASDTIQALERVGLVRALDHRVITDVIKELLIDNTVCLGVNISAQSARLDEWWFKAFALLSERRNVAQRLIIEMTETSGFPDFSRTVTFTLGMRALGVRIAVDDFGVGNASIRHLLTLQPDIVKIAHFFLRNASDAANAETTLRHIIGLTKSVAPIVIAEGVETAADRQVATQNGVEWHQGHFLGAPSPRRDWLVAGHAFQHGVEKIAALAN